jgi:hypothetical protein
MAQLIVGEEKNLTQLNPRLFRGRVSSNAKAKVTEAIREANPHVDPNRLEPGTVLTIPDLPEVDVRGDLSLDEISKQTIAVATSYLQATLQEMAAAEREERKNAKAIRTKLNKTLTSGKVTQISRRDKSVKAMIEAARETLAAKDDKEREESALVKQAFSQWSKDLSLLRSKLPD